MTKSMDLEWHLQAIAFKKKISISTFSLKSPRNLESVTNLVLNYVYCFHYNGQDNRWLDSWFKVDNVCSRSPKEHTRQKRCLSWKVTRLIHFKITHSIHLEWQCSGTKVFSVIKTKLLLNLILCFNFGEWLSAAAAAKAGIHADDNGNTVTRPGEHKPKWMGWWAWGVEWNACFVVVWSCLANIGFAYGTATIAWISVPAAASAIMLGLSSRARQEVHAGEFS